MQGDEEASLREQAFVLVFLDHCFTSLEIDLIREQVQRLVRDFCDQIWYIVLLIVKNQYLISLLGLPPHLGFDHGAAARVRTATHPQVEKILEGSAEEGMRITIIAAVTAL